MAQSSDPRYHCDDMFDQLIGLVLAILAVIYLAYAMLRPERF